jgi:purine nucleosidase
MFGFRTCTLHDPLAAAVLHDPSLATYRELPVGVELHGTHTRGQLVVDHRVIVDDSHIESEAGNGRRPVKAAMTVDADTFLSRMFDALT